MKTSNILISEDEQTSSVTNVVRPWDSSRLGLVSLYDMLTYAAETFCLLFDTIGRVTAQPVGAILPLLGSNSYGLEVHSRLELSRQLCEQHGWRETGFRIVEIQDYLAGKSGTVLPAVVHSKFSDLSTHLQRVLSDNIFLHVSTGDVDAYDALNSASESWKEAFPIAWSEFGDGLQCYVCGSPTASVFHAMRALDVGLTAFAVTLNVKPSDRDQWQKIIDRIESAIGEIDGPAWGQDWKRKRELYSGASVHFRYVKDAWRNRVMHGSKQYSSKEAHDILKHVSDFIAQLHREMNLSEPTSGMMELP